MFSLLFASLSPNSTSQPKSQVSQSQWVKIVLKKFNSVKYRKVTIVTSWSCNYYSLTRVPSCLCKSTCLDVVEPVCASNGKTYRNQCTMDQVMSIFLIDHFICVRVAKLLDTSTPTCQCLNFSPALLSCSKNWIDLYVTKVWKYIREMNRGNVILLQSFFYPFPFLSEINTIF